VYLVKGRGEGGEAISYKALTLWSAAGLTALAIVLKLRVFEIPYPPAPFLKYDLSGVPLAILAYMSLRAFPASLLVYFLVNVLMSPDPAGVPIGMSMKVLAEISTLLPLVLALKRLGLARKGVVVGTIASIASRVLVMSLANYLVAPHWLVMARWVKTYEEAYKWAISIMPHIAVFNATLAVPVCLLTFVVLRVLKSSGLVK
jgi:riboflavin transporter FmnP